MEYKRNKVLPWITFAVSLIFSISYVVLIVALKVDLDININRISLITAGVTGLAAIVLALVTGRINKVCDPLFERTEAVSARYTVLAVILAMLPLALEVLFLYVVPDAEDLIDEYSAQVSLIITIITIYATGFPLLLLALRRVPKMKIEKRKPELSFLLISLLSMCGLCLIGTLIGLPFEFALTLPFQGDESSQNAIAEILSSTTLLERVAIIGIIGPLFEELLFRKLLVERTIKYGETFSIILSGFMFGLFHGNFQQFFFASLIGMLFAFIFIRTGNIIYPVLLHMTVNLTTSIVTASLYIKLLPYMDVIEDMDNLQDLPEDALMVFMVLIMWMLFLFLLAVTGITVFCVFNKRFKPYKAPGEPGTGKIVGTFVRSPMFWSFVVVCLGDFGTSYLPDIVNSIIN